jgi:hypothetical protein
MLTRPAGMSIHEEIAADAVEIFAAFGKEIRLPGQTLHALISEPQETLELNAGGFGSAGGGYFRVSAFNSREKAREAADRLSGLSW